MLPHGVPRVARKGVGFCEHLRSRGKEHESHLCGATFEVPLEVVALFAKKLFKSMNDLGVREEKAEFRAGAKRDVTRGRKK